MSFRGTVRRRVQKMFTERSRTKQEFRDECNINTLMKRYRETGLVPQRTGARYEDVSDVPSYQAAMEIVMGAQEAFESLSAELRARFRNDPARFLAFVHDPANVDELVKLGLATAKPEGGDPGVKQVDDDSKRGADGA